jgi:erythromycin esterase-like protein
MDFSNRFGACAAIALTLSVTAGAQTSNPIPELLQAHQFDLASGGQAFLLTEAGRASFLVVGGLHGDQETQALIRTLSAGAQQFGYRDIAVEMSPWAASRLQASLKQPPGALRIWGADIEEVQPHLLINDLAAINPGNRALQAMVEKSKSGYRRELAPELLQLARQIGEIKDRSVGGFSLYESIVATLDVEAIRASKQRFDASTRREAIMKQLFISHYRAVAREHAKPKFIVSFGQSHMGRGIDTRGVSTLGNFVAELAAAEGVQSFHILLFAAGGKYSLGGLHAIDQRKDDLGFEFLASLSRHPAALFDLRPIRQTLHALPSPLSPRDAALLYWADAFDAVICYREVTPLATEPAK